MNANENKSDIMILGAGPAGLTAAIYARRYGYTVRIFEGMMAGGQMATTPEVENYPGIARIDGFSLSMAMKEQAELLGAQIVPEQVTQMSLLNDEKVFTVASGSEYYSDAVIIANGAVRRKLGCDGEERLSGMGVSYCATCDGAFFKGKRVAIVGGGNTALEDALFLANGCEKVYLIHRRDEFRGIKQLSDAVRVNSKIEILYNSKILSINGNNKVESITTQTLDAEKKPAVNDIELSAVFVAVGTIPNNQIAQAAGLSLDENGYFNVKEDCVTEIDGVFAAGDCRNKPLRQIVTATADGAAAAFSAAGFLNSRVVK